MPYLEVVVQNGNKGKIAETANGISLARSNGCLTFFMGSYYPDAYDYFNRLEREGWSMTSSKSSRFVGMVNGMPIANSKETYNFSGNGKFEIEWVGDSWQFKEFKSEARISLEKERAEYIRFLDKMVRKVLIETGNKYITKQESLSTIPDFEIMYNPPALDSLIDSAFSSEPQWLLHRSNFKDQVCVKIFGGRFPSMDGEPEQMREFFYVFTSIYNHVRTKTVSEEELENAINNVAKIQWGK